MNILLSNILGRLDIPGTFNISSTELLDTSTELLDTGTELLDTGTKLLDTVDLSLYEPFIRQFSNTNIGQNFFGKFVIKILRFVCEFLFDGPILRQIIAMPLNNIRYWRGGIDLAKAGTLDNIKVMKGVFLEDFYTNMFWLGSFTLFFIIWDISYRIKIKDNQVEKNKFCSDPFSRIFLVVWYLIAAAEFFRMYEKNLVVYAPWVIPYLKIPLINSFIELWKQSDFWFRHYILSDLMDTATFIDWFIILVIQRIPGWMIPMYQRYHIYQIGLLLVNVYASFWVYGTSNKFAHSILPGGIEVTINVWVLYAFSAIYYTILGVGLLDAIRGKCFTGNVLDEFLHFCCGAISLKLPQKYKYRKWDEFGIYNASKYWGGGPGTRLWQRRKEEKERKEKEKKKRQKQEEKEKKKRQKQEEKERKEKEKKKPKKDD